MWKNCLNFWKMIIKKSNKSLNEAVSVLRQGGVVICPTDTVYGFLADGTNKKAVEKIFKIKKRPRSKSLPVFVRDFKMVKELAEINDSQLKTLTLRDASGQAKYWPGKYTFVFKIKKELKLYGQDKKTIALRIPKYKFLNILLKKINKPLVQTSANISGEVPLTKIKGIIEKFGGSDLQTLIIDGGDLKKSKPSQVFDLTQVNLTRLR